jgi:ribose 5-phosphate isomerase B
MKIALGSDKSGFYLKEAVKKHLIKNGYKVDDFGTQDFEKGIPYYEVAPVVAKKVQQGAYERGILICGTGMGMAVVANKFKGIYAAAVESVYGAIKCRAINNANILTMGGWIIAETMALEMVDAFLKTEFTEGLEEWRREFLKTAYTKVAEIERNIYGV